ncbi:YbaN family protein [Novosphingobium sp. RD2P27]|uniref:YbaN family protein n=1 Tax=Novosphingobium kalidii TaxID=3230299 RepID=A0ABV2D3T0_9SPHN
MRTLAESSADKLVRGGRMVRTGWLLLGFICIVLGFIGAVVPLMPTTIFMILAAGCFARSSPRLETWLLQHPRFGPSLRAWRNEGAVPGEAKLAACIGMTIGYLVFWWMARPGAIAAMAVATIMLASCAWILSRPLPRDSR